MKKIYTSIIIAALLILQSLFLFSQDSLKINKSKFDITTDIVSRFIWRGLDAGGASPHIQPAFTFSKSGFEAGAWASYGISNQYAEVDIFAKYVIDDFSITATNYFSPVLPDGTPASVDNRFYNFKSKTTANIFELALQYEGTENFPLKVLAATFLYGNDRKYGYDAALDADSSNYYSTYIELGYSFNIKGEVLDVFAGFTPRAGFYGNGIGLMNAGLKCYRDIKITDNFTLPVTFSLITNPQAETIYAVFGITF